MAKTTLITVFTRDRYAHLSLCLRWLLTRVDLAGCEVIVIDDGSTDGRVEQLLRECFPLGLAGVKVVNQSLPDADDKQRGARIGACRAKAVDLAVRRGYKNLLMLDDDILVGPGAVQDAIHTLAFLRGVSYANAGALTLHGLVNAGSAMVMNGQVFIQVAISGEGCVLFPVNVLAEVGNHYSTEPLGFGDLQFKAIRAAGLCYYDRIGPPFQVQHLGYGENGSAIYRGPSAPRPFWVKGPFVRTRPDGARSEIPIQVDGFNLGLYDSLVRKGGGENAPLAYIRETRCFDEAKANEDR